MEENHTTGSRFKKVCVFCGSNPGNRQVFSDAAIDLANQLVKRKMDLVYGGGSVGLMGLISRRMFEAGCHVLGVIPKALMPIEFALPVIPKIVSVSPYVRDLSFTGQFDCANGRRDRRNRGLANMYTVASYRQSQISGESVGEVRVVADMHERKADMAKEAEAFIALPGGYGTMEETLEMITWAQLGIHKKPVGLLNVAGYYDCLLQLFDNGVKEGFIKPEARDIVLSAPSAEELLAKIEKYNPTHQHIAPHESWQMQQLGDYPNPSPSQ